MIKAIIKNPTFLYIKFDISGSGQLGLTSGWLRSQQPFIHPWSTLKSWISKGDINVKGVFSKPSGTHFPAFWHLFFWLQML